MQATPTRKHWFKKFVWIVGCLYSLVYLLAAATPYINPQKIPWLVFVSYGFPIVLLGMLLWYIIVLLCFRKRWWLFLIVLLCGYANIRATIGLHTTKPFTQQKPAGTIRIMSWNVRDFVDSQKRLDTIGFPRRTIIQFIKEANADILCIQDFTQQTGEAFFSCLDDVTLAGKYPYYYYSIDFSATYGWGITHYGTAIFSKYPIIDSGKINYKGHVAPEALAYADVRINNNTLRVFNTHLKSMNLNLVLDKRNPIGMFADDSVFIYSDPTKKQKIEYFTQKHVDQAKLIKTQLSQSPHPFIFCADLNSVPTSYVYHTISNGLTDAFVAKGGGLSPTYIGISPTLRIDVILMSPQLKTRSYYAPQLQNASDHYPVITDIELKPTP